MRKILSAFLLSSMLTAFAAGSGIATGELLDRGVSAFKTSSGVFVSWRCLDTDPDDTEYEVYRDGEKVFTTSSKTNYTDAKGAADSKYVIKAVSKTGNVSEIAKESKETAVVTDPYLRVKLDRPANCPQTDATYTPNDCSVGDVDGDGEYEIFVKWDPFNSQDNSIHGRTSNVFIDCYKLDGTKLWRVDLGPNIRAGAHYTQFMVYDFDGDGKAELMVKTAPGAKDSKGKNIILDSDDPNKEWRNSKGHIIDGPEYLTVFNGLTGEEINTIYYNPPRTIQAQTSSGWGDSYGGRSERYLAGVAYLGGKGHSGIFVRGYYTYSYVWAVDFDGQKLTERWLYSSPKNKELYGEGSHSLTIGDVDKDGFDEIIIGAAAVDHDGKFLHRTGAAHGDALHMGDLDPDHDGLEIFMVHEETGGTGHLYDATFRDAKTGEILWSVKQSGNDIGRGLVGDISKNWRGYECWPGAWYGNAKAEKSNATFDCKGNFLVEKRADTNFRIYWDGDLLDELFDGKFNSGENKSYPVVTKRNAGLTSTESTWDFSTYNAQTCNTTKATPCLQADIFGDWREEIIMWDGSNSTDLLIFQSTIPTDYKVPCLMTNHGYRMAIAWQNTAYNQPPHLDYYLSDEFDLTPKIVITGGSLKQTVEKGQPIQPITGRFEKCTTVTFGGCSGLTGLTGTVDNDAKTFTITGTPKNAGTTTIRIYASGGKEAYSVSGSIQVVEEVVLNEVAHYSFEEMNEYVTNHVQGAAKVYGTPTLVDGIYGKAISLNGESDYISQEAYDNIQLGSKDFTIEFWMKSDDNAAYILHKGSITRNADTGTTGNWIGFELKNNKLTFAIDDDDVKSAATCSADGYFNNEWVHVVLVRDHSNNKILMYLNGEMMAEAADGTGDLADNNEPLTIGNVNVDYNNYFKGLIDDFHIYHGAMIPSKVKGNYDKVMNQDAVAELDVNQPKHLTLVDAQSGLIIAEGVGEPENVLSAIDNADKGHVYILVVKQGVTTNITKIVK